MNGRFAPPRRLFRTSAFRLALLFAALFLACAGVLFITIDWYATHTLRAGLRGAVSTHLATLEQDGTSGPLLARDLTETVERNTGVYALLQDAQGRRVAGNLPAMAPVPGWIDFNVPGADGSLAGDPHPVLGQGVRLADGSYLLFGQDAFALDELRELIARAFLLGTAVTLLIALAGGFVVSRRMLHRLAAVGQASQEIMHGDLSRRLPTRGTGDEFDQLLGGFNALLDRIAALMNAVRQAGNDIAHDLRTPLSRLRHRLEKARGRPRSAAEYEAVLDRSIADTEAILETFSALLRIAQVEGSGGDGDFVVLDSSALVGIVAELCQPLAEERGQTIATQAEAFMLRGDRELLLQMLLNLAENACRHGPAGTHVAIGARREAGMALLWVADDGPGIPATAREAVLRRFYRLETSRSTPGNGLGLALVAAIAARHGAGVTLADARPGSQPPGLRAEVRMPLR